jgi:hypothetical protein
LLLLLITGMLHNFQYLNYTTSNGVMMNTEVGVKNCGLTRHYPAKISNVIVCGLGSLKQIVFKDKNITV